MAVPSPLGRWRARDDLTLEDVVAAADALLQEVAPRQTRYAVADRPDVRTIRYYTTRGLLPKPLSYDGGRARYGYAHLVRLLAIKRMQAEHMTLEQIARVLAEKNDDDVAALVLRAAPSMDTVPVARSLDAVPSPRAAADLVLELSPGGRVIVPASVVADPQAREQMAHNLEQLARFIRAFGKGGSDV